jgi:Carboxypeptidase regulatory-like domain
MADYRPTRGIRIEKPCGESWEAMPGDVRVRRCGSCDRDVYNVASMMPEQIEAMLAKPGPLPCMRIVRNHDGSLLAARNEQRPNVFVRASMALSTVMLMAGTAAAQGTGSAKPETAASLIGQVVDPKGQPIAHADVELWKKSKMVTTIETDEQGKFRLGAAPGNYSIYALEHDREMQRSQTFDVTLRAGLQEAKKAIHLQPATIEVGEVVAVPTTPRLGTRKVKTTAPVQSHM